MKARNNKQAYEAPVVSIVLLDSENPTLTGSLEPIDGGNNPDVDW